MAWSRIFGHGSTTMILPAMIAGALGPAALYLVLRRFGYAVSIAFLLGAALTVCETAITYSGRVKSYTTDVLVILSLCVLLPWLAKRRWSVLIAAAWFLGSVAIASFSSFVLLATAAAAAVLVLHPQEDRKLRLLSVGAQGVALLGIVKAEDTMHNAEQLADFFKPSKAYIEFHLNPVTFGREIIEHLVRVTDIFPGGPGWVSVLCMIAATVGLVVMARRGSKAVVGRFLVSLVLLVIVGALAKRVPFGPTRETARVTLWLAPVVVFGLAVVLQRVYSSRRGAESSDSRCVRCARLRARSIGAAECDRRPPGISGRWGARHAQGAGAGRSAGCGDHHPADLVHLCARSWFARERAADSSLLVGFKPKFVDTRLHPIDFLSGAAKREDRVGVEEHELCLRRPQLGRPGRLQELHGDSVRSRRGPRFRVAAPTHGRDRGDQRVAASRRRAVLRVTRTKGRSAPSIDLQ